MPVTIDNLKRQRIWCLWRYEDDASNPERKIKRPVNLQGHFIKTTDPNARWTYAQCVDAFNRQSDRFTGLGILLVGEIPGIGTITGVDLDNAIVCGIMKPRALEIVKSYPTYWELSPSETGAHGIFLGSIPKALTKTPLSDDGSFIEAYCDARFFTFTERPIPGSCAELGSVPDFVIELARKSGGKKSSRPDLNDLATRCWADVEQKPKSTEGQYGSGTLLEIYRGILRFGLVGPEGEELAERAATERSEPPWPREGQQGWLRKWEIAKQSAALEGDIGTALTSAQFPDIPPEILAKVTEPEVLPDAKDEIAEKPFEPFPDHALQPVLRDYLRASAEHVGFDTAMIAPSLLTTVGATIGNRRWCDPTGSWPIPPTFWAALIGVPSVGKSTAIDIGTKFARLKDHNYRAEYEIQ
jgi:hypothetical protein